MKKLLLILLCLPMIGFGQIVNSNKYQIDPLTGAYNYVDNLEQNEGRISESVLINFDYNCSKDFWTKKSDQFGVYIQKWSLINNLITGGDTILIGGGSNGIAFCGDPALPTFYSAIDTAITYYDRSINQWVNIQSSSVPLYNNGGYENDQYYMGTVWDTTLGQPAARVLYYFDGLNLITIDSLQDDMISVADIAVDTLGRAWVFLAQSTFLSTFLTYKLNVYDNTGFITSYNITFNSYHAYGAFFLNDILYVGFGNNNGLNPNSIIPIIINGGIAQLGTSISFPDSSYSDMASCPANYNLTNISEGIILEKRKLLNITDVLGRETKEKKNQPLFYIYDDGTVEKRIVIE
jgi:hypothetical protein